MTVPRPTVLRRIGFVAGTLSLLAFLFSDIVLADDREIAARLTKQGAMVKLQGDVATEVVIASTEKLTDDDFRALGKLTGLKRLQISGEGFTDATLAHLGGLTALEDVQTNLAQFSDEGLKQLTHWKSLKQIKFFHTSLKNKKFTGKGLAHLAVLPELRRLTVAGCPFNDEGLAAVAKITQLESFRTWHTYQSIDGTKLLAPLKNLKSLHLGQRLRRYDGSSNAVSLGDATVDALLQLTALETLILDEAKLSANALRRLGALPHLKRVELNRTDIAVDDLEKLRKDLSQVQLVRMPLSKTELETLTKYLRE